ncbi:MAG TPA: transposase [Gammaproteobacteria bacterium]|nr:transposase [Gammaproteobacteria bacterium]
MSHYRRATTPGATYFFTVVTHQRKNRFTNPSSIELLREAFRTIKARKPFEIEAIVVLPDHIHCLWKLPEDDHDFSGRWREIKKYVTKRMTNIRNSRKEGDIWQRRFWEHQIRNETDWRNHMDYIHYNPVRHGYVTAPGNWRWSSFHQWAAKGAYELCWGANEMPDEIKGMKFE